MFLTHTKFSRTVIHCPDFGPSATGWSSSSGGHDMGQGSPTTHILVDAFLIRLCRLGLEDDATCNTTMGGKSYANRDGHSRDPITMSIALHVVIQETSSAAMAAHAHSTSSAWTWCSLTISLMSGIAMNALFGGIHHVCPSIRVHSRALSTL